MGQFIGVFFYSWDVHLQQHGTNEKEVRESEAIDSYSKLQIGVSLTAFACRYSCLK